MKRDKQKENFKTFHLLEVKEMLGLKGKGFRTVYEWCKKHSIPVLGNAKRKRILQSDWIRVHQLAYIKAVRHTFPNWEEMLEAKGIKILQIHKSNIPSQPQSQIAKNFMKGRAA